jgi:hypothetical protein
MRTASGTREGLPKATRIKFREERFSTFRGAVSSGNLDKQASSN